MQFLYSESDTQWYWSQTGRMDTQGSSLVNIQGLCVFIATGLDHFHSNLT